MEWTARRWLNLVLARGASLGSVHPVSVIVSLSATSFTELYLPQLVFYNDACGQAFVTGMLRGQEFEKQMKRKEQKRSWGVQPSKRTKSGTVQGYRRRLWTAPRFCAKSDPCSETYFLGLRPAVEFGGLLHSEPMPPVRRVAPGTRVDPESCCPPQCHTHAAFRRYDYLRETRQLSAGGETNLQTFLPAEHGE